MKIKLSIASVLALSLGFVPACASEDEDETTSTSAASTDGTDTTGGTTGTGTTGTTDTTTTSGSSTDATSTTSGTTESTTTSGTTDATTATTTSSTTGIDPLPDGSSCIADSDCESEKCYSIPILGGLCGECKSEADCTGGGCTIPNPIAGTGSVCNEGMLGQGCDGTESTVCADGLQCTLALSISGIIDVYSCGECATDADCTDGAATTCAPTYDVANFSGQRTCIEPNSLPNGSFCDLAPGGGNACESGICGTADIMGIAQLGVCSECATNDDCTAPATCTPPTVELDGSSTPGTCG